MDKTTNAAFIRDDTSATLCNDNYQFLPVDGGIYQGHYISSPMQWYLLILYTTNYWLTAAH